jgi:hypothetical protein
MVMMIMMMVVTKSRLTTNLFVNHFSETAGGSLKLCEAVEGFGRLQKAAG